MTFNEGPEERTPTNVIQIPADENSPVLSISSAEITSPDICPITQINIDIDKETVQDAIKTIGPGEAFEHFTVELNTQLRKYIRENIFSLEEGVESIGPDKHIRALTEEKVQLQDDCHSLAEEIVDLEDQLKKAREEIDSLTDNLAEEVEGARQEGYEQGQSDAEEEQGNE